MKKLLQVEYLAEFALSVFVFSLLDFAWWWYPVLLLTPDLSMLGYVVNTKVGAMFYNFFHHKALGILTGVTGYLIGNPGLLLAGVILYGHSAMDRIFGYGLKYNDDFKNTHLGRIGS